MFKIEKLNKLDHARDSFCSINPLFNNYLQKFANQDSNKNRSKIYVVVKSDNQKPKKIYGYFTINAHSIAAKDNLNPNLPHTTYGYLPAILIGRLAIDKNQNQLRGYELLGQVLIKCKEVADEVGVSIILVEPIDEHAIGFYQRQGFMSVSASSKYYL